MDMFISENPLEGAEVLFAHGGAMGNLLAMQDWVATPLGAVSTWPQSLRTTISICLSSGFPMLILWGPEHVQFYNDAFRPILGTKHPRAIGQQGAECWAEIWEVIHPMFAHILAGGEAVGSEDQPFLLDRSGSLEETFFTFSYSPIRDETGKVGGILCTVKETTRQVLSERRVQALRELAARTVAVHTTTEAWQQALGVLATHAADMPFALLYELAADGSQAHLMGTAGVAAETLAGQEHLVFVTAGVRERAFLQVMETKQPLVLENWYRVVPGALLPRDMILLPIARAGEETMLAGLLVVGIHPYHPLDEEYRGFFELVATQLAAALANAHAHEEERLRAETFAAVDRAKTVFFHNISHEFRTPLTLSLGPLETLLSDRAHPLGEEQRVQVEMAYHHVRRQLKLVNTLLDFARIEAGKTDANYQPTDLAQLTTELASAFQAAMEQAGLRLVVDCPPLPELIYVDREMWEKIVLNLLSNAFKFTLEGTIRIALQMGEESIALQVEDTGVGIRETDVPHLFERFYQAQTRQARTQEGSGIGLALVQELVHLHAGNITVVSKEGVGTTFTICLPTGFRHLPPERVGSRQTLASATLGVEPYVEEALRWLPAELQSAREGDRPFAVSAWEQEHDGRVATRSARLLVVDDNVDMRAYLDRLLSPFYQVRLARDGSAALADIRETRPDLILSDVMMPGVDGFALLKAVRAAPATASIPVLLLSARAGEEATLEGLQAGATDYLVKPFSAREVLVRVQVQLEMARLRQEAELARQHLQELFMQAPAAICVLHGPEHVFELLNPLYQHLLGSQRDIRGKSVREALPELEGQGFYELLDQVYTTGEPFIGTELRAELARSPGGMREEAYFNFVYQPLREAGGEVEGIMVHAVEVTEQVRVRQRMDTFLGIASHELKNPLTSIKGNVDLARRRVSKALREMAPDKHARDVLEGVSLLLTRADQQITFQNRLVSDLVDTTRIQVGKLELLTAPADLHTIVSEAVAEQRQLFATRVIRVELAGEGAQIVSVDADRIGQVVTNYLSNALKYSEPEQSVSVNVKVTDTEARVTVQDAGPGLSPEEQHHIWERFYRAPGIQVKSGTGIGLGLGLYICQMIIEEHGGHVGIESVKGTGSTFWFTLPLLPEEI